MNFEFSEEQQFIQREAHSFLADRCPTRVVREVLEGESPYHQALWASVAELGWPATAIDERYGGLGLGYLELCVLAEELGRALAPIPFASTVYLAAEAIKRFGSDAQRERWLPAIAAGEAIGCLAVAEAPGNVIGSPIGTRIESSRLSGNKIAVTDGSAAVFAIVTAGDGDGASGLYLVEMNASGVGRQPVASIDPSRKHATISFDKVECERLDCTDGVVALTELYDAAAVLLAFEQVGGAAAALEMARTYTAQRYAFGRPVASFQAIKHKLADMYVALELARSNAYYGAWALSAGADELPLAAATARVSATDAYYLCAKENIQSHGGMGFTWEFDCHLYYRRAQLLASMIGSQRYWKDVLVDRLLARPAA